MNTDRRQFLQLGAAALATAPLLGAAGQVSAAEAGRLGLVRVCNTACYPAAAGLNLVAPGETLAVKFAFDPAFVADPSAGFWRRGLKVGDAPREQRRVLGRMLAAGCEIDSVVDHVQPAEEHSDVAVRTTVRLYRGRRGQGLDVVVPRTQWQIEAEALEPSHRLRMLSPDPGLPPVFVSECFPYQPSAQALESGDLLRVGNTVGADRRDRATFTTMDGRLVGTWASREGQLLADASRSGIVFGALVLDAAPFGRPRVAIYLLG